MEFDSISPAISGVMGGMLATSLVARWSRNLPGGYRGKSRQRLAREHRASIWTADALFFVGLFTGVALYPLGGFADTDWRPLLWGFGLASVLSLLAIAVVSLLSGRRLKEGFVAFALGQGSPVWLTYLPLGAGVVAFGFVVADLVS